MMVFLCFFVWLMVSNVNFVVGVIVINVVFSVFDVDGWVCVFLSVVIDLVIDVDGYFFVGSSFVLFVFVWLMEICIDVGFIIVDG